MERGDRFLVSSYMRAEYKFEKKGREAYWCAYLDLAKARVGGAGG